MTTSRTDMKTIKSVPIPLNCNECMRVLIHQAAEGDYQLLSRQLLPRPFHRALSVQLCAEKQNKIRLARQPFQLPSSASKGTAEGSQKDESTLSESTKAKAKKVKKAAPSCRKPIKSSSENRAESH